MKLSETRKIRIATVDLGDGHQITIKYRSFTPNEWDDAESQAQEQAEKDREWGVVIKLSKVLIETGIEEDNGPEFIPPTVEGLRRIEAPVLGAMLEAVLNTTLPKKAS